MNSQTARPALNFEMRFECAAAQLTLCQWLSEDELRQLCDAAFYARLCNIAFNGLGGCGGQIKPDREFNRIALERAFMRTCQVFWSCRGVKQLPEDRRSSIRRVFLAVSVAEENFA
jgi:hypothetical protein